MIYPVDSDSTLHYNKDKHIKAGNVLESSESQKIVFNILRCPTISQNV